MWAPTDEAILAAMAAGDRDAAVAFVRRFQRQVYGLALAVTRDAALADDVAQDAFLRAWRAAPAFDSRRGTVQAWLLTITRNLVVDALRLRRAQPSDPSDLAHLLPASTIGNVDVRAVDDADRERVRDAVATLPAEQRRAVLLAVVAGHTAAEISAAEGIPLGTAKTRIRTAMQRLRTQLADVKDRT